MTLYLTDLTSPEEIRTAKASGAVFACKLYPQGATTNSDSGVTDVRRVAAALEAMAESVREMKSAAMGLLTGADAEEAGFYFDYVVGALS